MKQQRAGNGMDILRNRHHQERTYEHYRRKSKTLGMSCLRYVYSRKNLMVGGKIEVFVMSKLLISWPRQGLECDALVGPNILNEILS